MTDEQKVLYTTDTYRWNHTLNKWTLTNEVSKNCPVRNSKKLLWAVPDKNGMGYVEQI